MAIPLSSTECPVAERASSIPLVATDPEGALVIEVQGLTKAYAGGPAVLDRIDLEVRAGEVVALVGSNGAGKSTLLRCLARLTEPDAGRITIGGTEVTGAGHRQLRQVRAEVGFVFQRFHLVPRLSVFANVLHGALGRHPCLRLLPLTTRDGLREEAMECLGRVGLRAMADRRVDTLSGGQQQRAAIARMLMQQPLVVLADEPVASLDPVAGLEVMDLLREIAVERSLTVVAALHQLDMALTYTNRVIGLRAGRMVLDRPTAGCDRSSFDDVYQLAVA